MNSTDNEKLLDHEYDGIKELDNPLPKWWLVTFYLSIIFAVIYFAYYEFMGAPTQEEQLNARMTEINQAREVAEESTGEKSEETFVAMVTDKDIIEPGKIEFMGKCLACHGANGQGLIGPNLTDEYWIHGDGSVTSMIKIINEGITEKGMPPWKGIIAPDLIEKVAVYVYSLQGSDPAGAKAPEGNKIEQ